MPHRMIGVRHCFEAEYEEIERAPNEACEEIELKKGMLHRIREEKGLV